MKTSICPLCGKEFTHARKQTYCKNPHVKKCAECGKEFVVPYHRLYDYDKIVNCGSAECAGKRRSASMKAAVKMLPEGWNTTKTIHNKICKWCGEPFETNVAAKVYCDRVHFRECIICGKKFEVPNERLSDTSLTKTCSAECDRKFREQNTLAKYGVSHYSQTQEWKDKIADKKDEIDAKRRATSLERFGVEHASTLRKKVKDAE
jgi:hypothetical protein